MTHPRPFRFAVQARGAASGAEWLDKARKAEAQGYDVLSLFDHFAGGLGALSALAAAATVTTRLRLGTFVLANDFRHPALLAKDAATVDLLSEGRLELGVGAGWMRPEYDATGIPFDPAPTRIARLDEAIRLLKLLFGDEPATFAGDHYRVSDLTISPKPVQRPHPPLLVGGGGRRILELAAHQADIVAFGPQSRPDGTLDEATVTAAATARKADWVRQAVGEGFSALELNVFVYAVEVTDDRHAAAERLAADFKLPAADLLASPHTLIGSVEAMVEDLHARREQYGLTYVTVGEHLADALAPVVARLAAH
jgi:probable F420-dependent oxidoreductase